MKTFIYNSLRIELLENEIIHIEKAAKGHFFDGNTFFVPTKTNLKLSDFDFSDNGDYFTLYMNEYYLVLYKKDSLRTLKIYDKYGSLLYRYQRKFNCGELPPASNTPCLFPLFDNPRVKLYPSGYSLEAIKNHEEYQVEENVDDCYILIAKSNPLKLRELYIKLTGPSELVRFKNLGFWHSRYFRYNQESAMAMIKEHARYNIPLDNMVIDTDWRKANDIGIGYEIANDLFPSMEDFFKFAKNEDVEIMFNDHPEPYRGAKNAFDKKEMSFRINNLTNLLKTGLSTWWYDRNWSTCLKSISKHIEPETIGDYLFYEITKNYYQSISIDKDIYLRPIIMANVNNVFHGEYIKINDSASHRYSIQWTGDIASGLDAISKEVKNLIKGCSNEITYINADIGGHVGNPNKEEYLRWIQFATFSPIFRVHATNSVIRFREPWNYDEETIEITRKYLNLRYRLLPLIYTKCFDNYSSGEPLFKSLDYCYFDKLAKNNYQSYLLADSILVSPFKSKEGNLAKKNIFINKIKATYYNNLEFKEPSFGVKTYDNLCINLNGKAPLKGMSPYNWTARYEFDILLKEDSNLIIASDDGCNVYVDNKLIHQDNTAHAIAPYNLGVFKKKQIYHFVVELYQYGGGANLLLLTIPTYDDVNKIYLPTDNWIDLFNGQKYLGNLKVTKDFTNLLTMPLFIKEGSIIPLVKEANRALQLDYRNLTLDYYPSLMNEAHQAIYEDDKLTTAYKLGQYRKTYFDAYYLAKQNSFMVHISKAIGNYQDDIYKRKIILKFNLLKDIPLVNEVRINGENVAFKIYHADVSKMPLEFGYYSNIADTLVVEFEEFLDQEYWIEFFVA